MRPNPIIPSAKKHSNKLEDINEEGEITIFDESDSIEVDEDENEVINANSSGAEKKRLLKKI